MFLRIDNEAISLDKVHRLHVTRRNLDTYQITGDFGIHRVSIGEFETEGEALDALFDRPEFQVASGEKKMEVKVTISRRVLEDGGAAKYKAVFEVLNGSPFGTQEVLKIYGDYEDDGTVCKGSGPYDSSRCVLVSMSLEDIQERIQKSINGLRGACINERLFQAELPAIPEAVVYCL